MWKSYLMLGVSCLTLAAISGQATAQTSSDQKLSDTAKLGANAKPGVGSAAC
jgi:hypothetical protein